MNFVIRSAKGDYWTGKRVEDGSRFRGSMMWTQDVTQAATLSSTEADAAFAHPLCPPGVVLEEAPQ